MLHRFRQLTCLGHLQIFSGHQIAIIHYYFLIAFTKIIFSSIIFLYCLIGMICFRCLPSDRMSSILLINLSHIQWIRFPMSNVTVSTWSSKGYSFLSNKKMHNKMNRFSCPPTGSLGSYRKSKSHFILCFPHLLTQEFDTIYQHPPPES